MERHINWRAPWLALRSARPTTLTGRPASITRWRPVPSGAALGKLPDLIEPAVHPHHRQFFHSVVVAAGLVAGMRKLYQWAPDDDFEKLVRAFLLVGGAAYLSHLALDALTSRSLPLVGKI